MSFSPTLPAFPLDDFNEPKDPSPPRWQLLRLGESNNQEILVLRTATWMEATGFAATTVHDRLRRLTNVDVTRHLRALREGGILATDLELAVHARVYAGLWHGGFAAACIHLLQPRKDFNLRLTADEISTDPSSVGVMGTDPNGPPFIALARDGKRTECLLLTWCHEWQAFPGVFLTDEMSSGDQAFLDAFGKHMRAVTRLLGSAAVSPQGGALSACAN